MLSFLRNKDKNKESKVGLPFLYPQSFEELAGILRYKGTTFIYKHSTRCSVSLFAMKRLLLSELEEGDQWVYIDVVAQRPLSLALAEDLKVQHQSPQLIVIKEGKVHAHASHQGVNEDTINIWRKSLAEA
ncbi:MAG: bacillithiol system redox-active protein YtxJ [Schleiferiaceae bacterium]|nr:bacillithiol system redox-active protein YtxJ [Schleiferiaceae bacterium]